LFGKSLVCVFVIFIVFIAACATKSDLYKSVVTVAIWNLKDLSPSDVVRPDLGELLSTKVIETFKETDLYIVIERERLLLVLEELNLGTTLLVDETTQLRIGKLVGAQLMVFGGYQVIGEQMRLDLRLVEVETGRIRKAAQKTVSSTDLPAWLNAAKETAAQLF
jgi:curli biogenesis system outer membrane secretion channel CsgG